MPDNYADQDYAARQANATDAADGRAILTTHPELLNMVRPAEQVASIPPNDKVPQPAEPAAPSVNPDHVMSTFERLLRVTEGPAGLRDVANDVGKQLQQGADALPQPTVEDMKKPLEQQLGPEDYRAALKVALNMGGGGTIKDVAGAAGAEGAVAGAAPALEVSHETPAVTPESAAQTLADKQIEALKAARVGKDTAEEFGRPDIATTVPEALTMQESQSLRQSLESYYSSAKEKPQLAAHVQAMSSVYQEEAQGLYDLNQSLRERAWKGEDVSADLEQLHNRWAAIAENYSGLAGTRSEAGRAMQILSPNKPGNAHVAAVAALAQELGVEGNPQRLSDMLAGMPVESYPRVARQTAEDFHLGRSLYNAFHEYYVDNLLSNAARTTSHIGTSNAVSALMTLPVRQIAAALPGSPYKMGEPMAGIQGFVDGFWHSVDVAVEAAKTGQRTSQIEGGSVLDSPFMDMPKAISGQAFGLKDTGLGTAIDYLGSVLRLPTRGITAVHQFGHSMAASMSGHMLAWRDAVDQAANEGVSGMEGYRRATDIYHGTLQDMPDKMRLLASQEGDVTTFANKLEGPAADLHQFLSWPVLKQLMPFFRVAYNVTKMGADVTPGIGQLTNMPELITGSPAERASAVGKMAFGAIMGALVSHEFHQGNIELDKYGKPFAKVGDYRIAFPPPLDFPVAAIGNYLANRDQMDEPTAFNKVGAYARALGTATADNTIVQGLVNLKKLWVDAESGDPAAFEKFAGEEASGLIPFSALLKGIATGTDTVQRAPKTFGQEIQSGIPGMVDGVPKAYDIFAKETPSKTLALPDALVFPVNVADAEKDPVKNMIADTKANFTRVPNVIFGRKQKPGESVNHPDIGVPLDGGAQDGPDHLAWTKARADGLYAELDEYRRGDYKNDSPDLRKQQIQNIGVRHAHDATLAMLENPRLAKLYDQRMDRKAGVNTPADTALTPAPPAPGTEASR